jgi:hypothetical protein
LTVSGSPYRITYHYTSDGTFASAQTTTILTATKARPTVSIADAGGTFNNAAFPATVGVAGVGATADPSLEGVAPTLAYYSGTLTTLAKIAGLAPLAGAPSQAGSYTVVASFPGSADYAATQSAPVTFNIGQANAIIGLTSSGGAAVFGQPVTFTTEVTAPGSPSGAVTFFDGTTPLGTVTLDGSGRAVLTVSNLSTGSHSISASYSGDANLLVGTSGTATESVARAGIQVILVRHPVFRRKKVVSVGLTAKIEPLSPSGGTPSGLVKLLVKKKLVGSVPLNGGVATLAVKGNKLLKRPITVIYNGDQDFLPVTTTPPVLTQ